MSFSHDSQQAMPTHHIDDDGSRFKVLEDHTKKQKPKACRQEEEISNAPKKPPRHPTSNPPKNDAHGTLRGSQENKHKVRSSKLRDTSGKTRKRPISQGAR